MKKYTKYFSVFLLSLFLVGCGKSSELIEKGNKELKEGRYEKANEFYQMVLKEDSENREAMEITDEIRKIQIIENYLNEFKYKEAGKELEDVSNDERLDKVKDIIKDRIEECKKPNLYLDYTITNNTNENEKYFYFNGVKGILLEEAEYNLDEISNYEDKGLITRTPNKSNIKFLVENRGEKPVINPKVNMKFNKIGIKCANKDWKGVVFNKENENWEEVYWISKNGEIKGGENMDFELSFSGIPISYEGGEIEITLSGDNIETRKFNIEVELR